MMDDLSFMAGRGAEKLRGKLPNKIVDGLETFSKKDFTSWEKDYSPSGDSTSMEAVSDEDLSYLMQQMQQENSLLQVESTSLLTSVINNAASKQIGAELATNKSLASIDVQLQKMYDYQTRVQSRNEAVKISLLGRMHLTNAKYYQFVEAAMHRQIEELKAIAKSSSMSDYEKTSLADAAKKRLRDGVFNTLLTKSGGFAGALGNMLNKDGVNSVLGDLSSLTGDLRMGMELT